MSFPNEDKKVAGEGVNHLPPRELLRQVLASHIVEIPAGRELVRGVWNERSVWPQRVDRVHRFGPPESMKIGPDFPFFWVYAADELFTAVWEAQLCTNPATHPGRFMLAANAAEAATCMALFIPPDVIRETVHMRSPHVYLVRWGRVCRRK